MGDLGFDPRPCASFVRDERRKESVGIEVWAGRCRWGDSSESQVVRQDRPEGVDVRFASRETTEVSAERF